MILSFGFFLQCILQVANLIGNGSSKRKQQSWDNYACEWTFVINTDGNIFLKIIGEEDVSLLLDTLFAYSVSKNVLLALASIISLLFLVI